MPACGLESVALRSVAKKRGEKIEGGGDQAALLADSVTANPSKLTRNLKWFRTSDLAHAAVDMQFYAGDIGGVRGSEEGDGTGDFF